MRQNRNRFVIGITGGIGSGKSTILDILHEDFGAEIVQADGIEKLLTAKGGGAYEPVRELFGPQAVLPDGGLDRGYIASQVYADREKLNALEAVIHPAVREYLRKKTLEDGPLLVLEAALPVEAGFKELCDETWYIYVKRETRIERLMRSRGYTRKKCLDIMSNQLTGRQFVLLADRVIDNNGSVENVRKRIHRILGNLL